MSKIVLPNKHWWDNYKPDLYNDYDYFVSKISGYSQFTQLKFNSVAYPSLKAEIFDGTYYFFKKRLK
jgi:hypothetical protein